MHKISKQDPAMQMTSKSGTKNIKTTGWQANQKTFTIKQ
jgi:hypothetical protein